MQVVWWLGAVLVVGWCQSGVSLVVVLAVVLVAVGWPLDVFLLIVVVPWLVGWLFW